MKDFANKTAVLVGAADALASAVCGRLLGLGCRVGVLAPSAEEFSPPDRSMVVRAVEPGDRAALRADLEELARVLGPVDLLLHRAPIYQPTAAAAPAVGSLRDMLQANCLGGIYAVEAVLPGMLARGRGHIVELASLAALGGTPGTAAYAATTRAFATFLESLRPALRRRGILVTTAFVGFGAFGRDSAAAAKAADWVVRLMRAGRREGYHPWRFGLAARLLRRLPAWAYDAWAPRFERFLAGSPR